MKKKIINGIMMVALVAATSTSFVSCKDTNEDVRVEMQQEYATLLGKLNELESKYKALEGLKPRVEALEAKAKNHEWDIEQLKVDVDNLEAWAKEAFNNLVMSASIDATYNNFTGSINIPGAEPMMLFNNYGTATTTDVFPSVKDKNGNQISWAAGEELGSGKDAKVAISEDGNVNVTLNGGFAGYLYASVNRFIPEQKLQDKGIDPKSPFSFDLVDSRGEAVKGLMILNVEKDGAPTNDLLTWGWTRAENNMFKFGVAYAGTEASKYAPAKIDLAKFKDDLKAVWRNRATGTSKQALGKLAADLYYNLATKNTTLPKYRLRISWQDNFFVDTLAADTIRTIGMDSIQHFITADGNILFAAFKPLGFNSGNALAEKVGQGVATTNRVIEKSEVLWNKIFNKVKAQFPNFNPINFDLTKGILKDGAVYYISLDNEAAAGYTPAFADLDPASPTYGAISGDIDITNLIVNMDLNVNNGIASVNEMFAQMNTLKGKLQGSTITNWLEKFTNKFNKVFANNAQQMLEPVLLAIDKDGNVSRVSGIESAPSVFEGEITLDPTSYSVELFAPAYAKYVACDDITANGFNEILFANDVDLKFTPESGKTYKIVYEAVDFTGVTRSHTYYIQGK